MTIVDRRLPRSLTLSLALVLAACGGDPEPAPAEAPATAGARDQAPSDSGTPAVAASAPAEAPAAGSGVTLDEPIADADVATRLVRRGEPMHVATTDRLEVDVEVFNDGKVELTSEGTRPVHLGVTLAGPEGVDTAPGVRDFQRVRLPPIPPGESRVVKVSVPAAPLEGLTVRLELVQERVAWFGQYGQETLDIGLFGRCDDGTGLCDAANGSALASR